MKFEQFKEKVETLANDYFYAEGCRECHEVRHNIIPNDDDEKYEEELKKLWENVE